METHPEKFPDESQPDPSQQAEDRVFDAIQGSDHPGFENHDGQPHPAAPEMDFTLWLPGVGHLLLEIKGVRQSPERGKEHLEALDDPGEKHSPLCQTWDAAMAFREAVVDTLGDTCCFVIAVLLFPDMEPDPAIVAEAKRSSVKVPWGTDNPMNRLA